MLFHDDKIIFSRFCSPVQQKSKNKNVFLIYDIQLYLHSEVSAMHGFLKWGFNALIEITETLLKDIMKE